MITPEQIVIWTNNSRFTASDIDCTTAVVLKILDQKCKMESTDKHAVVMLYDRIKTQAGDCIDPEVHKVIATARMAPTDEVMLNIHKLRVHAESLIAKPVMKAYKQMLRQSLAQFACALK